MAAPGGYDTLLVDLDGTVWLGPELVPGGIEALTAQQGAGRRVVFVTNDARSPSSEHVERLRGAGVDVADDGVVTSGDVTVAMAAREHPGAAAFAIGTPAFLEAAADAGFEVLDAERGASADVVLIASAFGFAYPDLRAAIAAIFAGAAFYGSNRDRTLPMPDGLWPGTGTLVAAIEYATEQGVTLCGKPERHLFEEAVRRVGGAERPVMVGDRLDSDVAGAHGAGIDTVLVLTGAAEADHVSEAPVRPDHVVASLADIGTIPELSV